MDKSRQVYGVLGTFPENCRPAQVTPLGAAGGMSGATFWRLETPLGPLCLRRWPQGQPDRTRLELIHAVLQHVQRAGFSTVPVPLENLSRQRSVEWAGQTWELTPWLPGRADYRESPSPVRLAEAFRSLAAFHLAAAMLPHNGPVQGAAPAVLRRLEKLRRLQDGGIVPVKRAALVLDMNAEQYDWAPRDFAAKLASRCGAILARFAQTAAALEKQFASVRDPVALQPCIGDIHDRHVLFQGDRVSGIVDFGTMRFDNVATDIARLLGTMAGDDAASRAAAVAAYQQVRPLSDNERRLVDVLDRANVILGGVQWLQWLVIEGRSFESADAVLARVDRIIERRC